MPFLVKKDRFIDYASWGILIVVSLMLKLASSRLENIIDGKKFGLHFVLVGIAFASCWMVVLKTFCATYFNPEEGRSDKRASAILSQFFAIVFLTLFASEYYNSRISENEKYLKKAWVEKKSQRQVASKHFVRLSINNKSERFVAKSHENDALTDGDSTTLYIGHGRLGYDFIIAFDPK